MIDLFLLFVVLFGLGAMAGWHARGAWSWSRWLDGAPSPSGDHDDRAFYQLQAQFDIVAQEYYNARAELDRLRFQKETGGNANVH